MRKLTLENGTSVTSYFYPFTQALVYLTLAIGLALVGYDLLTVVGIPLLRALGGG
jgi:hypothetical protein